MAKVIINRNKKFVCSLVPFYIYINGEEVGTVKNGKEFDFDLNEGTYELFISKIHYVNGRAKNSGYGGLVGAVLEASNSAKELNRVVLDIVDGIDTFIECESNAVDCEILNVSSQASPF